MTNMLPRFKKKQEKTSIDKSSKSEGQNIKFPPSCPVLRPLAATPPFLPPAATLPRVLRPRPHASAGGGRSPSLLPPLALPYILWPRPRPAAVRNGAALQILARRILPSAKGAAGAGVLGRLHLHATQITYRAVDRKSGRIGYLRKKSLSICIRRNRARLVLERARFWILK